MSEIIYGCLPSVVKEPCPRSTLCRGALSLKCVKLGNNPKFYDMRTAQCKVGKQTMWGERGRAKLEPCSSACESPDTHSKAGSPGNISLSTVCPYYLRLDRVLLWPPCLTAHKRRGFWDLILSPCCVFWGNSFLLETRSPHSVLELWAIFLLPQLPSA